MIRMLAFAFALGLSGAVFAQETLELGPGHEIPDVRFLIDIPLGWAARGPAIAPSEAAAQAAQDRLFFEPGDTVAVAIDHESLDRIRDAGLPAGATLEDLLRFHTAMLGVELLTEPERIEIFGVPALSVEARDPGSGTVGVMIQGFIELPHMRPTERVFLLTVEAPSRQELDRFLPTWEAMLASLRPAD